MSAGSPSYVQRAITVTVVLGTGSFGQSGQNSVTLKGLRVAAVLEKYGYPSYDKANIRIYGLPASLMQQLSTLGVQRQMVRVRNSVLVEAGDAINGMAVVYSGYILDAWADYSESPDTSLNILGGGGQDQAIIPVGPRSFPTSFDVATALSGIATSMGWAFENSGANVRLPAGYYPGTALEQVYAIASDANIECYADSSTNPITLAIWPKLGTRGGQIPLISAATGLIGWPRFQSYGMSFKCLFNPNIKCGIGGVIQMQSSVGGAPTTIGKGQATPEGTQTGGGPNGLWFVRAPLIFDLASQTPGGPWYNEVECARVSPGLATPVPAP